MSPAQQHIWVHEHLGIPGNTYNIPLAFRLQILDRALTVVPQGKVRSAPQLVQFGMGQQPVNELAGGNFRDGQVEGVGADGIHAQGGQILGLFFEAPKAAVLGGDDKIVAGLMQLVIELRNNLRAEAKKITSKDDATKKMLFAQTDIIRQRLAELGIALEDRPAGTTWRVG